MTFGEPAFLLFLVVVALLLAGYVRLALWQRRAAALFAGPQASSWRRGGMGRSSAVLLLGAALLLVLAAARPQWGDREFASEKRGIDFVIALDVSLSMLATDAEPNRLALAQGEISRLISTEQGSRFGLVLFAGTAITRSPLTTDAQAISELIQRADGEAGLIRVGSDLGAALAHAAEILGASENPGKAVLIVSDGEDHGGSFMGTAGQLVEQGIVPFAAGVGTAEGSAIPDEDAAAADAVRLDPQGQPIITRLDEENLRAITAAGGGRYISITRPGDILALRQDLAGLEEAVLGEEIRKIPVERFQIFVAGGFALLVVSWFLAGNFAFTGFAGLLPRSSPQLALALLPVFLIACGTDPLREPNGEANRLFEAGEYEAALAIYQELVAGRPDVAELSFNSGNSLHRLGNFERAIAETQRALPPAETGLGAHTYFALGNHYLAAGNLDLAFESFRSSLLLDPADADAKHNLELVLSLIQQEEDSEMASEPGQGGEQQAGGQQGTDQNGQQAGGGQQDPTPAAGGDPGGTGSDPQQPAASGGASDPADSQAAIARALEEALRGIDRDLTFEEALQILDLLQQQQAERLPPQRGSPQGPDY